MKILPELLIRILLLSQTVLKKRGVILIKLKHLAQNLNISPKMAYGELIQLCIIAYIFIKELNYIVPVCKILYQCIKKYGYYKSFQFLAIFAHNF